MKDVGEGTPAADAGFEAGDVVVEFDGERVRSATQLSRLVWETPAGREVSATVMRDGIRRTLPVTPEPAPAGCRASSHICPTWTIRDATCEWRSRTALAGVSTIGANTSGGDQPG